MKKLFLLFAGMLALMTIQAQPDAKKQKQFIASIKGMDNTIIKGRLVAVNDSQVILKSYSGNQRVPVENITTLTLKRKNSVLKGTLIGFGIGAVTGIIIGLASGNDPIMPYPDPYEDPLFVGTMVAGINNAFAMTAGQKAVAGGLALGTTGAIVGAIVGAVAKKKFIIGNKKERFHDLQGELMMKLVKK